MAKTIKFNLICDGNPVRTLEDLQNNFSIEDILAYYNNKLLHRWLEVRGYREQLERISKIEAKETIEIIKELIRIFEVEADNAKIEEGVYILRYLEEKEECYAVYSEQDYKVKNILDDYETGYWELVNEIRDNPNDVAKIKANIGIITTDYKWILQLNHRRLFYVLLKKSPLAIMCLLMNPCSREYYLPKEIEDTDGTIILDIKRSLDKKDMYDKICSLIKTDSFKEGLGENLHSFSGVTEGYWKDLEAKGKEYMVISMENGNFVRSAGEVGGDLAYNDIQNNFVILDGIDYKSNSANHKLYYMEV